jgi:hypothetical protein
VNMRLDHQTELDDTLTHQVRFTLINHQVNVSCVCRSKENLPPQERRHKSAFDPIGISRNIDEGRLLYNDPKNHFAPFTEEDKAKW